MPPQVTKATVRARVVHLLSLFTKGKIKENEINDTDSLLRFFPNNNYSKLLFGGHIHGIFPNVSQTTFINALFTTSLDTVSEVVDNIIKYYPNVSFYKSGDIASNKMIEEEFDKMKLELSQII